MTGSEPLENRVGEHDACDHDDRNVRDIKIEMQAEEDVIDDLDDEEVKGEFLRARFPERIDRLNFPSFYLKRTLKHITISGYNIRLAVHFGNATSGDLDNEIP